MTNNAKEGWKAHRFVALRVGPSVLALILPIVLLLATVRLARTSNSQTAAEGPTGTAQPRLVEATFSGTALGSPARPARHDFAFDVPTGAIGVKATLSWSAPFALFTLALVDPDREVRARGMRQAKRQLVAATMDPPRSGTWIVRLESTLAENVPFEVRVVAELTRPGDNVVRQTTRLDRSIEVNLMLEEGDSFSYSFEASTQVRWNVHTHPTEGVKYWAQGTDAKREGLFMAPARGVYSLHFENDGALPVELTYALKGKFRLYSHPE